MKRTVTCLLMLILASTYLKAQTKNDPATFHGATADRKAYKALYILNNAEDKKIRATLRNIKNALEDPRLKGKLQVELVVFGDGVNAFRNNSPYDSLLLPLSQQGVILAQCENTLRERKISKEELWPFISFVPSGNGEIIIRQHQGWATIHP